MQAQSHKKSDVFSRLDFLRVKKGLTWAQLAKRLAMDPSAFFHVKAGRRNLSDKALYRLAEAEKEAGIAPPEDMGRVVDEFTKSESRYHGQREVYKNWKAASELQIEMLEPLLASAKQCLRNADAMLAQIDQLDKSHPRNK